MTVPSAPSIKIRTLIVDDEPLARSNIAVLLRSDPEIQMIGECGSGAEALAEIRVGRPDLLFLDVQMPECDGFDVLEMLGSDSAKLQQMQKFAKWTYLVPGWNVDSILKDRKDLLVEKEKKDEAKPVEKADASGLPNPEDIISSQTKK